MFRWSVQFQISCQLQANKRLRQRTWVWSC